MKFLVGFALVAALVACKSKETAAPQAGSGSAAAGSQAGPRLSQGPLPQLPVLTLPDDPKRADKIELGHVLFFDERLSANKDRSCYSCHKNEDGNGGHDPFANGSGDKVQPRHAPMLWNVAYFSAKTPEGKGAFYWDGRAASLEDNAKGAWGGGNMGVGKDNLDKKAAEIVAIPGYKKLFDAAFPGTEIKADHIAQALSEYERTFMCKETAYDKFAAGDKTALTEPQQRGLDLFVGKAMCIVCHAPPYFSTAQSMDGGIYFNVGIGTGVAEDQVDTGRMKVTNDAKDWGKFKPPTLRNISKSAPYFHDGSVAKLEDAVKLMSSGGIANKNKDPNLADRGLTDAERADLVAFLGALDCPGKLDAPKAMPQ
jgi:cytochrome c peroxidase